MEKRKLALLAVLFAGLMGGAIVPMIKIGLRTVPPLSFTFLRFLLAFVFLLPFFLKEKPDRKSLVEVGLPTLLSSINIILFIFAVRLVPANIGQLVYVSTPIIVTVLSAFTIQEKLSVKKMLGIILGLAGTIFLLTSNTIVGFSFSGNYSGFLMILIGAVLFSIYLISTKKLQKKYSPVFITSVFNLETMLLAMIFSIGELKAFSNWAPNVNGLSVGVLLYVAVFGTSLFYLLGQYAVKHGSAVISSLTQYVQVPFTILWASALIGEKVTPNFYIASAAIILGAYLASG